MGVDEVADEVATRDPDHLVLTGGEPLIHDAAVDMLNVVDAHATVETNGTRFVDADIDLASISPKLSNSTPTPERDPPGDGEWADRHDERRLDHTALARLIDAYPFQLKFVIAERADMPEIESLVADLRDVTRADIRDGDVLLMPEGATRARLAETRDVTARLAEEHGYEVAGVSRNRDRHRVELVDERAGAADLRTIVEDAAGDEIGRASCRERVCLYV